jgi:hypothetical protein
MNEEFASPCRLLPWFPLPTGKIADGKNAGHISLRQLAIAHKPLAAIMSGR